MVFMGEAAHGEAIRAALEELKKTDRKSYDHIMRKYVEPKEPEKKKKGGAVMKARGGIFKGVL